MLRKLYERYVLGKIAFARQHPLLSAVSVLAVLAVYAAFMYLVYKRAIPGLKGPCFPGCSR
jgi:hypothetical protein